MPISKTSTLFRELHKSHSGQEFWRIKSSVFYWLSFASVIICLGIIDSPWGMDHFLPVFSLLVFWAPCFALYPLVRLLFGGKDGLLPAIATAMIEEVIKVKVKTFLKISRSR